MGYQIRPQIGVADIRFGSLREQIRSVFPESPKVMRRTPESVPADFFKNSGVLVYYRRDGGMEAIEFAEPAEPEFDDERLLGISFSRLKEILVENDRSTEFSGNDITSYRLGIGAYSESGDPKAPASSVIVFEKGYYD